MTVELDRPCTIDRLMLQEDLSDGQVVMAFDIWISPTRMGTERVRRSFGEAVVLQLVTRGCITSSSAQF